MKLYELLCLSRVGGVSNSRTSDDSIRDARRKGLDNSFVRSHKQYESSQEGQRVDVVSWLQLNSAQFS